MDGTVSAGVGIVRFVWLGEDYCNSCLPSGVVDAQVDGPLDDPVDEIWGDFPGPAKSAKGDARRARGGGLRGGFEVVFDFLHCDILEWSAALGEGERRGVYVRRLGEERSE